MQRGGTGAEEKMRWWQMPWVPPLQKEQPSEEELARKAAIKEKAGQRLRDMANAKRSSKIAELEANFQGLEYLLQVWRINFNLRTHLGIEVILGKTLLLVN